jgi:hypothetical protein
MSVGVRVPLQTSLDNVGGELLAYDDFTRYQDGALSGQQPVVGPVWQTSGASPITIQGGKATASGLSAGYAILAPSTPPRYLECTLVFTGTDDGGQVMTMAWAGAGFNDLLHHNFGMTRFSLTLRNDGGTFDAFMSGSWRGPIVADGVTRYRFGIYVRGATVTVVGPDGEVYSGTDPRVRALSQLGTVFWEPVASATLRASLLSIRATGAPAGETGVVSPVEMSWPAFQGSTGWQALVAAYETYYQVKIGRDSTGLVGLEFGPTRIVTYLTAAAAIGATSIVTAEPLRAGATTIGAGTGAESKAVTGTPSPSPTLPGPYTATIAALTKAHAAGELVIGAGSVGPRLGYNPISGFTDITGVLNLSNDVYRGLVKILTSRRTGWTAATGTKTRTTFDTATVTLPQLAEHVAAVLDDLITHGLIGA